MWKGIIEARPLIRSNSCYKIGNSFSIHPLFNLWIPRLANGVPQVKVEVDVTTLRRVVELNDAEGDIWNVEKLEEFFSKNSVRAITKIPWPSFTCEDKLICRGNAQGTFQS